MGTARGKSPGQSYKPTLLVLLFATPASAAVHDAFWLGGSASWGTPSKWSGGVVPKNTAIDQYDAYIDGGLPGNSNAQLGSGSISVNSLTLDAGSGLSCDANANVTTANFLVNNGGISAAAGCAFTVGPNQSITGGGSFFFYYGSSSISATSGSLTLGPGLSFQAKNPNDAPNNHGQITIGSTAYPLTNHASLLAADTGTSITLRGQTFTNDGLLQANAGASILVNSFFTSLADLGPVAGIGSFTVTGTIDNTQNTFILDGSVPNLKVGGTVTGGTLTGTPGQVLTTSVIKFDNVSLNIPTILTTQTKISAGQSFHGNADVQLSTVSTVLIPESGTLMIDDGLNIHGRGTIGVATSPLVSNAPITADVNGAVLTITSSGISGTGPLSATNGGILTIAGAYNTASLANVSNNGGKLRLAGTLDNTNATLSNTAARRWDSIEKIVGGTFSTAPGADFIVPLQGELTLDGVTLNGTIQVVGDDYVGTHLMTSNGLTGNATIVLIGAGSLVTSYTANPLSVGAGITVTGHGGPLGYSGGPQTVIHGRIQPDADAYIDITGSTIISDGVFALSNGSRINAKKNTTLNSGAVLDITLNATDLALLNITGNLDLSSEEWLTTTLVTPGTLRYQIVAYSGTLTGVFDHIPDGYTVDYSIPHQIFVNAPEPTTLALLALLAPWTTLRRKRRAHVSSEHRS